MKTFWQDYRGYLIEMVKNEPKALIVGFLIMAGLGYFIAGWVGVSLHLGIYVVIILTMPLMKGMWDDDPFHDD